MPSVTVEWLNERYGFAVKVGGNPVYASKNSMHAEGVADFIRGNNELAEAFASATRQTKETR